MKYLKRSFLTGRSFATLEDLNQQLDAWLDAVANVRVHGTTKERPIDRYAREAGSLRLAAAVPRFDTRELLIRKVQNDSHIRLAGTAYRVPPVAVGRSVHVRVQRLVPGEAFEVLLGGEVIASHTIANSRTPVTLVEHAAAIKIAARRCRRPQKPRRAFRQTPPDSEQAMPIYASAPLVQTRALSEYERLLEAR